MDERMKERRRVLRAGSFASNADYDNTPYVYHITIPSAVRGIQRNGLRQGDGRMCPFAKKDCIGRIWLTRDPQTWLSYFKQFTTSPRPVGMPRFRKLALIRVEPDAIPAGCIYDGTTKFGSNELRDCYTTHPIPPELLELRMGRRWVRL